MPVTETEQRFTGAVYVADNKRVARVYVIAQLRLLSVLVEQGVLITELRRFEPKGQVIACLGSIIRFRDFR